MIGQPAPRRFRHGGQHGFRRRRLRARRTLGAPFQTDVAWRCSWSCPAEHFPAFRPWRQAGITHLPSIIRSEPSFWRARWNPSVRSRALVRQHSAPPAGNAASSAFSYTLLSRSARAQRPGTNPGDRGHRTPCPRMLGLAHRRVVVNAALLAGSVLSVLASAVIWAATPTPRTATSCAGCFDMALPKGSHAFWP